MPILNHFVTAQCFLLLLFYPDAEHVTWMRSGNFELAYTTETNSPSLYRIGDFSTLPAVHDSLSPTEKRSER